MSLTRLHESLVRVFGKRQQCDRSLADALLEAFSAAFYRLRLSVPLSVLAEHQTPGVLDALGRSDIGICG